MIDGWCYGVARVTCYTRSSLPLCLPLCPALQVYLSFKKDAFSRCTLLCQIEDHQKVQFSGDAGAVGRLTVKDGSKNITIDLKGA
jgi:hypothetical protein